MNEKRVLIVAEDPLARAGVASMLVDQPGCTVVGQVSASIELPAEVETHRPDVLVWDMGWDANIQVEALSDIHESGIPVVALLSSAGDAAEASSIGIPGLLSRDTSVAGILAAIEAVTQGLVVVDPGFSPIVGERNTGDTPPRSHLLTRRELEVLRLVAEGLPNKSVSARLGISEHTVKFHVNSVFGKLGVQSRTEAVIQATPLGLVIL